jgi:hypothetical protein
MILFIGQIARGMREREAFQEVNYKAFFGDMAKWVVEVDDPARLPELIARAFRVAKGRSSVVVAFWEDVLTETAAVADAARVDPGDLARSTTNHCTTPSLSPNSLVLLGAHALIVARSNILSGYNLICRCNILSAGPFRLIIQTCRRSGHWPNQSS